MVDNQRASTKSIPMTDELWDIIEEIQKSSKNALIKNATDAIIFCLQRTRDDLRKEQGRGDKKSC